MNNMKDIRKKTNKELVKMLNESREKFRTLRFNTAGARSANVKERSNLRKVIAQILTEMRERSANQSNG